MWLDGTTALLVGLLAKENKCRYLFFMDLLNLSGNG